MNVKRMLCLWLTMATAMVCGCDGGQNGGDAPNEAPSAPPPTPRPIDIGLIDGYEAQVVLDGLTNPSDVTFNDKGQMTVCDAQGRVILVTDGEPTDYITGFDTEFWKVDPETGTKRYKVGPLSAVWLGSATLAVTDAGKGDGEERILFFGVGGGKASDGDPTNALKPPSDNPQYKGEGNLTGLSLSRDGRSIYVACQGSDAKTYIGVCDIENRKLEIFASSDEHGIEVNSPMQTLPWQDNSLLVLYSGTGGEADGLIVQWDIENRKPVAKWTLPGLKDPMGMAVIPGTQMLAVVDNNWSLTQVNQGKLAEVAFPASGDKAAVKVLADELQGPVSCAFGPDGRLYITQLGEQFDQDKGAVIAVSGFGR